MFYKNKQDRVRVPEMKSFEFTPYIAQLVRNKYFSLAVVCLLGYVQNEIEIGNETVGIISTYSEYCGKLQNDRQAQGNIQNYIPMAVM